MQEEGAVATTHVQLEIPAGVTVLEVLAAVIVGIGLVLAHRRVSQAASVSS